jgi:hypothetical protein
MLARNLLYALLFETVKQQARQRHFLHRSQYSHTAKADQLHAGQQLALCHIKEN